MKGRLSEEEL